MADPSKLTLHERQEVLAILTTPSQGGWWDPLALIPPEKPGVHVLVVERTTALELGLDVGRVIDLETGSIEQAEIRRTSFGGVHDPANIWYPFRLFI